MPNLWATRDDFSTDVKSGNGTFMVVGASGSCAYEVMTMQKLCSVPISPRLRTCGAVRIGDGAAIDAIDAIDDGS
jgi:hypothetical protein